MIKINLLSEGKRPAAVRKARGAGAAGQDLSPYMLLGGLLLGVLAAFGYYYAVNDRLEQKRQEVAAAQREVDELAAVIKEVDDFKHKKAELERKIKVINDLKLNQRGPVRVMDYISRAMPELLWLDRMHMGPSSIELEGRAFNTNAVANFMENLDKVPEFREPTLKDTQEQGPVYKFLINFDYSFAPPTPKPGDAAVQGARTGGAPGATGAPSASPPAPGGGGSPRAGAPSGTPPLTPGSAPKTPPSTAPISR
ncbi:MAG: PilN domain-containing protein [Acidobacteriota bacterium]|nr:PilN domain-containing protein [Acidobacteriota bacterium]